MIRPPSPAGRRILKSNWRLLSCMVLVFNFATLQVRPLLAGELPEASWNHLPRWRGFNLLEKFHKDWTNSKFVEDDFKWMSEWGFNFVRLPMDYRVWIKDG